MLHLVGTDWYRREGQTVYLDMLRLGIVSVLSSVGETYLPFR